MSNSEEKVPYQQQHFSTLTDEEFLQSVTEGYSAAEQLYALIEVFYLSQQAIIDKKARFSPRQVDLHYMTLMNCSQMLLRAELNQDVM